MSDQSQDPNADKSSTNILWGIIGIFALVIGVGYYFEEPLKRFYVALRTIEIQIANLYSDRLLGVQAELQGFDPMSLNMEAVTYLATSVGTVLGIPVAVILVLLALQSMRNISFRFTRKHDMVSLYQQEKSNWSAIRSVSHVDLIKEDLDKGPWAMSTPAHQFCRENGLFEVELVPDPDSPWKRDPVAQVKVKRPDAMRIFSKQLGPHWHGTDYLPNHARALFAVFAARVNRDAKTARVLLDQFNLSFEAGKLDFSGVDKALKKYINHGDIKKVLDQHAFQYTVMASMLEKARQDGVVATADFLWLKPTDRTLWYILNSVGRQVAVAEVAGIFAHWKAEKELGRPLRVPMVLEAVNGLELTIKELKYKPTEAEMQALLQTRQQRVG